MSLPVSSRIGVMGLPPFHGYGAGVQLYLPLASLVAAVVYAPRAVTDPHAAPVTPTTGNIFNYVRRTGCKALMTVSTFFGTVGSLSAECGGAEVGLGCEWHLRVVIGSVHDYTHPRHIQGVPCQKR
jgi:hypothetical protein